MKVKRFGVSLDESILAELDHFVNLRKFPNRSQAIRYLISNYLVEEKADENKIVAGSIVLVYDHHKRELQSRSTSIQHDYHETILSVMHVHINHHNCLETIAVMGKASKLKELADKLIAIKGVKHGKLVITATS
ncbi:MAG TPA: nickel-responsive transcriptional regulator NikR [Bacteroidales bacterium]|nr:nickel-responsive transcriptional regulator NikR [Bacteroidales bacterium]HNZ42993.1 nickel-responsive transcriptional regulator NikR [Bacteroidales bacterium]HOH83362.1 nickel-responsive transcriptional regulator NikR [Bacteroidales bacterium]HPB25680.1 nickel-responsive transcriptional regulator NikR [Bacteroidales bacterium]HPI30335.1 nickel-responsive transcriptional regulator NikR [Bacteroidales bacterium]